MLALIHTVGGKHSLSAHLLLISDDMSNAKWEIWISFVCRQSLIHWQKAQMWEDSFCNLDCYVNSGDDHMCKSTSDAMLYSCLRRVESGFVFH